MNMILSLICLYLRLLAISHVCVHLALFQLSQDCQGHFNRSFSSSVDFLLITFPWCLVCHVSRDRRSSFNFVQKTCCFLVPVDRLNVSRHVVLFLHIVKFNNYPLIYLNGKHEDVVV